MVENDIIIGRGSNSVIPHTDPTAHAEINAIRDACNNKKDHKLDNCILYSSCEPCCMCMAACYWAGINKIHYCNTREDAEKIGFSDKYIYEQLQLPHVDKDIKIIHSHNESAKKIFTDWDGEKY